MILIVFLLFILQAIFIREISIYGREVIHAWVRAKIFHQPVTAFVFYQLTKAKCLAAICNGIFVHITEKENTIRAGRHTMW